MWKLEEIEDMNGVVGKEMDSKSGPARVSWCASDKYVVVSVLTMFTMNMKSLEQKRLGFSK